MAQFTFNIAELGNTPITVEGATREEALASLQSASREDVMKAARQSLKARQGKTGITDADIDAILGGTGNKAGGEGVVDELLVGAGRTFTNRARGAMQLARGLLPKEVADTLRIPSEEKLAADEAEARKLFEQIDAGVGFEDVGEALPEMLAFFGMGAPGAGLKSLLTGTAVGASSGLLAATDDTDPGSMERGFNTAAGAVGGALAPLLGTSASALRSVLRSGKGLVNAGVSLLAATKGNAMSAGFALSRAMDNSAAVRSAAQTAVQAARAAGDSTKNAATVRMVANEAMDRLGTLVGQLRGRHAENAAFAAANDAFEAGFDAATGAFKPQAVVNRLARFTPADLRKMGAAGRRLEDYRSWAKSLLDVDDLNPQQVQQALAGFVDNQRARDLARAISRATNPETKRSLLAAMAKIGAAAGTGQGASSAVQNQPIG